MMRCTPRAIGWTCLVAAATVIPFASLPAAAPEASWLVSAEHAPRRPRSGEPVSITARVQAPVSALTVEYQVVEPGAYVELKDPDFERGWVRLPMQERTNALFQVGLPASLQKHRRLVRYRFAAWDAGGRRLETPGGTNVAPNFAYFVYDGLPAWRGAIDPRSRDPRLARALTFSPEVMGRVQVYHLLARKSSIENAGWRERSPGNEIKYTGTLVVGDEVFDHTGFRARGGVWRYEMGKNMWKFHLPAGRALPARDDFGRPYSVPWTRVNLRSCIQQGDYGYRGEQGMFESVGFRLFNLAGVPAPHTHWIQLRIIDEAEESPADQYRGDFWGLYLAIENEDGRFLRTHGLPDGNLYKMAMGGVQLDHLGAGAVSDGSDLRAFVGAYSGGRIADTWWRTHVDLPAYFSYRAICECIHHYDIGDGKNYDYHHDPVADRWTVVPWDIDLTWANTMYGNGEEPFKRRVLSRPAFQLEYQNRLREIRDLLFNPEQTGWLIDECAAVIWDPTGAPSLVEADRRKWDYHPAMTRGMKAGQGLFYEATRRGDFAGMVELMKSYVKSRGAWTDASLVNDPRIPSTPTVRRSGPTNPPPAQLRFRASDFEGTEAFAALKWRLAEVTSAPAGRPSPLPPRRYEITPVWESPELDWSAVEVNLPPGVTKPGHTYRVRVQMRDVSGRWSHWSGPVEFTAGT